jgi:hypothetical protein
MVSDRRSGWGATLPRVGDTVQQVNFRLWVQLSRSGHTLGMTSGAGCGRTLVFATRGGRRDIATTPSCCSHNRHRKASDPRSGWDATRRLSPGTSRPVTHRALVYSALSRQRGVRRPDSHARGYWYGLRLALARHAGTSSRLTRPFACCRVAFVPAPDRRSGWGATRQQERDSRQAKRRHGSVWRPADRSAR